MTDNENRRYGQEDSNEGSRREGGYGDRRGSYDRGERGGYNRNGGERGGYERRGGYNRDGGERGGYNRDGGERGGYERRGGYSRDGGERGGYNRDGGERGGFRGERRGSFGARPMRRDGNPMHREMDNELECNTVRIFAKNADKVLNRSELGTMIRAVRRDDDHRLDDTLRHLLRDEFITSPEEGKYQYNAAQQLVKGKLSRRAGKIVFVPEGAENVDGADELFVGDYNMNHALINDEVEVRKLTFKKDMQETCQVVNVLNRAKETFVGTLDVTDRFAFLKLEKRVSPNDIFLPLDKIKDGQNGQKAIVRWLGWEDNDRNPNGEVIEVLGDTGDNETEMHAILAEFDLPHDYPADVDEYAKTLSGEITEQDLKERLDYRDVTTFTIDPKDAKDFDDALSIKKLDNGNWEVGVHIADVSHFVHEGDIIDDEAVKRATSIYLVDRTIPMLPECLCNELCSLRQDEDKFAYSCIFELDDNANVLKYNIGHTLIRSNRRFCYEEAQERIETHTGDFAEEILDLDRLAKILRKKRFENGAINFESEEIKFNLDEKGHPIGVYVKVSKDANKLVEEFMLLANKTVAAHIGKVGSGEKAKTFVYRIHEIPDPDKLKDLETFVSRFNYHIKTEGKNNEISNSINKLINDVEGKKEQSLIDTIAVRSMQKAIYSTTNIGHYGLAFDYYTHFTSPIRRYPDVMVHRLLTRYAQGLPSAEKAKYDELCDHSSAQEILASKAERASIKYKEVEYMSDRLGETFVGVISGMQDWGLYVEIATNKCEGMVPVRDMTDDYYSFDEKNYWLIGQQTHKTYQIGEEVVVRVAKTNLQRKQMDLELIGKKSEVNMADLEISEDKLMETTEVESHD